MDKTMANLVVEMLEEQAALIQQQLLRWKSFGGNPAAKSPVDAAPAKKVKVPVDPNKPKRPASGYQLFMAEQSPLLRETNPTNSPTEQMSELARRWTALDSAKKAVYTANAEKLKEKYQENIKVYNAGLKGDKNVAHEETNASIQTPLASQSVESDDTDKKKKKKRKEDQEHDQELASPDKKKKVALSFYLFVYCVSLTLFYCVF